MAHFRRIARDYTEEFLTIVESTEPFYSAWLEEDSPFIVQVTHGDHFSGLFALDGEAIPTPPGEWWIPTEIPAPVWEAIEEGWSSGNYTVQRMARIYLGIDPDSLGNEPLDAYVRWCEATLQGWYPHAEITVETNGTACGVEAETWQEEDAMRCAIHSLWDLYGQR